MDSDEERLAAWVLSRARLPRTADPWDAIESAGSCAGALQGLAPVVPIGVRDAAARSFERAEKEGYRIVALTEPSYPRLLRQIFDPPIALSVWGTLRPEDALGISIVGSRRPTSYGLAASRRLSRDLARAGLAITSGLARGIDASAHRGALEEGGRTLAVLGSGLCSLYPREHRRLAEEIATSGAVLSEFDLNEPPLGRNFPRRNRVISGLTLGTIVVEAATKSGSLVSARLAADQNRDVFAVPGPIDSTTSEGAHELIRDGARLVGRAEHVLEELREDVREALRIKASPRTAPTAPELDEDENAVVRALRQSLTRPLDVDELLEAVALPTERTLAALSRLEVARRVRRHPDGRYRPEI
ncbi:MAG TPA: DNA-processing protein DprA [Vicinamibacteria bacterium]|nr:DNA-processing protein DprA [Vicinamibacteria bacterium]